MNKYSIILPVYNGGEYVKECVKSILSQSMPDFNLHVLDNCSTDGTLDWIRSLNDGRINFFPSGRPLTIEENWSRIITIPRNEYMTMIGHDDILDEHYLQHMNELIAKHPAATLYQSHYNYIDAEGNILRACMPMDEIQHAHEFLACQMVRTMESMGTGYMMRSKDYNSVGGIPYHYPNLIFADYELWVRLIAPGYKATTWKQCFSYRLHKSLSRTTNGMQYQDAFGKYIHFIRNRMLEDPAVKEAVTRYGKEMLMYFCESLSHRLLKTPLAQRSLKVPAFIEKCKLYAEQIIPGQQFEPLKKFRIRIAARFDQSDFGRSVFKVYKKFT